MSWASVATAAVSIGSSLLGGSKGSDASSQAAQLSYQAQIAALNEQKRQFNLVNDQNAPQREAGYGALAKLMQGFGIPYSGGAQSAPAAAPQSAPGTMNAQGFNNGAVQGPDGAWRQYKPGEDGQQGSWANLVNFSPSQAGSNPASAGPNPATAASGGPAAPDPNDPFTGYFAHQFNGADLKAGLAPNYDFMLQQGQGAATNALNLTGGLGGNFAQGLNQFTQNYAGNAYQTAFGNYTANQQNIFNRLSTIAGYGSTANSTVAGSANALTPGMANAITGAGQAQAAGVIGANANMQGGVQNAASWFNASGLGSTIANTLNNPILRYGSDNVFSGTNAGSVPEQITNWDS